MAHLARPTGGPDTFEPMLTDLDADEKPYFDHIDAGDPSSSSVKPGSVKRKKAGSPQPDFVEARRLRRSHEACARCRSKKIKCDSKHPRCSACQQAGTECHQEDRHRQTLTPRGHLEKVEYQLAQADALLKTLMPGFTLERLPAILDQKRIPGPIDTSHLLSEASVPFTSPVANGRPFVPPLQIGSPLEPETPTLAARSSSENAPSSPPFYQSQQPFIFNPRQQHTGPSHAVRATPDGSRGHARPSMHNDHSQSSVTAYPSRPAPAGPYAAATALSTRPHASAPRPVPAEIIKGQDPQQNDLSNARTLVQGFGVNPQWIDNISKGSSSSSDKEDSINVESMQRAPHNPTLWTRVDVHHTTSGVAPTSFIWLPQQRQAVAQVIHQYFERLNWHRPVFTRQEFSDGLDHLYSGRSQHDPGFICSVYLILALGSLCELNQSLIPETFSMSSREDLRATLEKVYRPEWPKADEFFERALAIKPDLRVTISSLQAMILLQWYLYIERHGRSLWRLVGNMTRLAIELGLHHDPFEQPGVFSLKQCHMRTRLWCIVMIHDRGTSILLGRPLAIAPSDTTTRAPVHEALQQDFSDHFRFSFPIMQMQGDIICSLYGPRAQPPDSVMRHAIRILQSMEAFRNDELPSIYRSYFAGTQEWSETQRLDLLHTLTADQGLTLLKFWICRIMLLRALFKSHDLDEADRWLALNDAIITSHNIIVIHHELIRFPDIAFFVSPIPLHIAAMIIIWGNMCNCRPLPRQRALDDVWLALDMLPHFRWRWERKDLQGGHPLISRIAEKVFEAPFSSITHESAPGTLIPEISMDLWTQKRENGHSPMASKQRVSNKSPTPRFPIKASDSPMAVHAAMQASNGHQAMSPTSNGASGAGVRLPSLMHNAQVHPGLFYPLDQDNPANLEPHAWQEYMSAAEFSGQAMHGQPHGHSVGARPLNDVHMANAFVTGPTPPTMAGNPATQTFVQEENDKMAPSDIKGLHSLFDSLERRGVDGFMEGLNQGAPAPTSHMRWQ